MFGGRMMRSNETIKANVGMGEKIDKELMLGTGFLIGNFDLADLDCAVRQELCEICVFVASATV